MRTLVRHTPPVLKLSLNAAILSLAAALAPCTPAPAQATSLAAQIAKLSACPVEMTARQRSASALREVPGALSGAEQGPRQGVTLTLKGKTPLRVTAAEIVVHGISPTPRAFSVTGRADADVTRTFHLVDVGSDGFNSDVWMAGVSALRWIELKSLTYSDGSEWHESNAAKCGIAPDPFVLVSAR